MIRRFLAAVLTIAPALGAQNQFTIEQVMSAPFASDLTAATRANSVAWLVAMKGVRNVWVATAPAWTARQVTSYTDDDGQELTELRLAPDGRALVYVRGGETNRAGERPNPALIPGGVTQTIWYLALTDGAAPRKIADGVSPSFSPSGDSLAFETKGQIWIARIGSDTVVTSQLTTLRGYPSNFRWSPDGRRLAFVSGRSRHSFIGVWDFAAKTLRYLDASTDQDRSPAWSPDGNTIAFIREPSRISDLIFWPERSSPIPWTIRVADAATGRGREVWRAKRGAGSVYHDVVAEDQLYWNADGTRIAFPWEADGWTHLYSVASAGGTTASLLTAGAFEVEWVTGTPDRSAIVFNSNQDDIDRRHVWKVAFDAASRPVALTHGAGIELNPAVTADGHVAIIRSDARIPVHAALLEASTVRDLGPAIPTEFPASQLVTPQQVIMHAADGTVVHGQLFLPPNAAPGERHPAAIFFHGGSRRQMLLGWHYMYYYSNAYAMNQYLANHGYAVLSVNYRSGIGYGLNFREALRYGAAGGSEYGDVVAAGKYMRARADVDPKRVALWGGSYGGYLTAMGLAHNSDMFAAGVDLHGVHDWNSEIPNFVPAYDSLKYGIESKTAYLASPLAAIAGWRSPVLLIHGDDDRNVPFGESVTLAYELRKRDVPVEELVFPDEIHDFLLWRDWVAAYAAADDFFRRKLGGVAGTTTSNR